MLKRVEDGPGCSVKDSFAVLDLKSSGFHVLFEATWIRRPAAAQAGPAATLDWRGVQNADGARTVVRGSRTRCLRSCLAGQ